MSLLYVYPKDMLRSQALEDPLGVTNEDVKPIVACRSCLVTEQPLQPLENNLADAYGQLISAVQASDIYPKYICTYCRALLLKFTAFRERCLFAQTTLNNMHSVGIPITLDVIKTFKTSPPCTLKVAQTLIISLDEDQPPKQSSILQNLLAKIPNNSQKEVRTETEVLVVLTEPDNDNNDITTLSDENDHDNYTSDDSDDTDIPDCLRGINSDIYKKDTKKNFKDESKKQVKPSSSTQIKVNKRNLKKAEEKKPLLTKLKIEESDSTLGDSDSNTDDSFDKPLKRKIQNHGSLDKVDKNVKAKKGQGLNIKKMREWIETIKSKGSIKTENDHPPKIPLNAATNEYDDKKKLEVSHSIDTIDNKNKSELNLPEVRNWIEKIKAQKKKEPRTKVKKKSSKKEELHIQQMADFEKEFNVKIVTLTKEQQIQQVTDRKDVDKYKTAKFKCKLCYSGFNTKITFENHMTRHEPVEGQHMCEICKRYYKKAKLTCHLYNLHLLDFICNQCGHVSKSRMVAKFHYLWHKGVRYDCKICGKSFNKPNSVNGHMKMAHGGTMQCSICNQWFNGEKGLHFHMKRTHKEATGAVCGTCNLQFHSVDAMRRHQPQGMCDQSPSPCAACGIGFTSDLLLRQHKPQCEGKKEYTCEVCNDKFDDVERYYTHMYRKHVGQYSSDKKDLARPKKSFMCEICGRSFHARSILVHHLMIHSGKSPFQCDYCGNGFTCKINLRKHIYIHMLKSDNTCKVPLKRYHCRVCNMMFIHYSNWTRHEKTVHQVVRGYNCQMCGNSYKCAVTLKQHVNTKHLGVPWPKRNRRGTRAKAGNYSY